MLSPWSSCGAALSISMDGVTTTMHSKTLIHSHAPRSLPHSRLLSLCFQHLPSLLRKGQRVRNSQQISQEGNPGLARLCPHRGGAVESHPWCHQLGSPASALALPLQRGRGGCHQWGQGAACLPHPWPHVWACRSETSPRARPSRCWFRF